MAWYNDYRPRRFEDVVGQTLTKEILESSLKQGTAKHAYLFAGPKGIGKTTLARIFASRLNNTEENPEAKLDIIEMDAASNTGIDDVRQLIESAKSAPLAGGHKIYIIDEVHMLSKAAMNALLKILEEPPEYLIFLLATTNPEKLIPTVLSRLTKLPLLAHTPADIVGRLQTIAEAEGMQIDTASLKIIAKHAEGSQRDAINLLETIHAYGLEEYTEAKVSEILGLLPHETVLKIGRSLLQGLSPDLLQDLQSLSLEPGKFLRQLLETAIEESFAGRSELEPLIIPLAETLSLNLPFNSLVSALAVVAQKLKPTQVVYQSKTVTLEPTSVEETKPAPELAPAPRIVEDTPKTSTPPKPTPTPPPVATPPQPPKPPASPNSSPARNEAPATPAGPASSVEGIILGFKDLNDCPPILRMILPDLQAEDGETGELVLTVTNGIFLAQLQGAKITQWLQTKLQEATGTRYTLNAKQRQKSQTRTQSPSEMAASLPTPVPRPTPVEPPAPDPSVYEQDTTAPASATPDAPLQAKETGEKIFYKVYKALPKEMKEGDLPVYPGPVPTPEPTQTTDEWAEVEDMFELE